MRIVATKGTCDGRNGRYSHCGKPDVWIACKSRGQCTYCSAKFKIERRAKSEAKKYGNSSKLQKILTQLEFIKNSQQYYLQAILDNQKANDGKCRCDECGNLIAHPTGRNVCHIVGSGANKKLYFDLRNRFILGKGALFNECNCGATFDDKGLKSTMNIFPKYEDIRIRLNNEHYTKIHLAHI